MTSSESGGGAPGFPRPFGKYTLLSHLAVGGMADVFLAQHRGPAGFEKECVIKRILPHLGLDQAFVQMFLDEARLCARLSHPNIVQIFDLGKQDGDYFLAMEYVAGVNLEQFLEQAQKQGQGALPWSVALRVVSDVAAGLDHAHNSRDASGRPQNLVHRDVSPSNVMISWGGAGKILDFGIAKAQTAARKSRTEVGTIKGKVPYMSPEQLQGLPLDGRSDVFSLGVILYEITCGGRPFPGETTPQLTVQIMNDEPQPPALLIDGYPPRLQEIVLRALEKKPERRWQTAREFEQALESFAKGEHFSCSSYDVEACLKGLFPEGRLPGSLRRSISGTERTEVSVQIPAVGRVATPYEGDDLTPAEKESMTKEDERGALITGVHQGPDVGPGGLADLGGGLDEMEREERRQRRRGGGGGMMAFIGILVVVTAGGLFFLRGYFLGHSGADPATVDLAQGPAAADLSQAAVADLARAAVADLAKVVEKVPEKQRPQPKVPRPRPVHAKEKAPEAPRALPRIDPDPE